MSRPQRTRGGDAGGVVLADRYRLEEPVASGGMGDVWRATDTLLERTVAVKLLRESLAEDPVVSERFRREALLAAQLSHPNMAGVYDYVKDDGRRGIVMEYVEGETLADRLARERRVSPADAVRIATALLAALQAAHDAGIVHRDVKPGNVMLTANGDVKVTDFGIARAVSDQTITETGMVVGTAQYLSPEQVAGRPATPLSDLYSVGAILYEMLSGRKPFQAETPLAVAMMRLTQDAPPLRDVQPDVPEALAQVVGRAMAREPEHRFDSADVMGNALQSAGALATPTAPVRADPEPTQTLPVEELAAVTRAYAPAPSALAEKRRREYRRLGLYAILLALVIGLIVMGALALTGGGGGTVSVPRFVGLQRSAAEAKAEDVGLKLSTSEVASDRPAGLVLTQDTPPGKRLARGEMVKVTVSSGVAPAPPGIVIPDVTGYEEDEAKDILKEQGFNVQVTREASTAVEEGKVIRTDPAAGTTLEADKEVVMVVSSGPPERKKRGKGRLSER
jgi:eukaryotic-like serine/threonine-protein kinase